MKRILTAAVCAAMLAGCGGGGGGHSAIPSTTSGSTGSGGGSGSGSTVPVGSSKGTATVIAKASLATSAIPQMYDRKNAGSKRSSAAKLKAMGATFNNVEVDGTLYQGSAAAVPVTNTQTVAVINGGVTVSETFSNVVPANNDWVVFEFYAVAADGSKTQLGSLGTFVNVGANTTTTNLGATSTQVLQVAGVLLFNGQLSTYDIEQTPALATTLASQIATFNPPVDAQTGLYDPATIAALATELEPAYERDITINAANASEVSIVYDSTQPDENDLAYNAATFATAFQLTTSNSNYVPSPQAEADTTNVIGAPLTVQFYCCPANVSASGPALPVHAPGSGLLDAQPTYVDAVIFGTTSGTVTIRNVYGGHLILGAHNAIYAGNSTLPATGVHRESAAGKRSPQDVTDDAYGANMTIAGEAPTGATPLMETLALVDTLRPNSTNTTPALQISDPAAVAFNTEINNTSFEFAVSAGPNAAGAVPDYNVYCATNDGCNQGVVYNEPVNVGSPSASGVSSVTFDTWSPFNIPLSQLEICSYNACAPVTSTTPVSTSGSFDDPLSDPTVYNWAVSETTSNGTPVTTPAPTIVVHPSQYSEYSYLVTYSVPANNTGALTVTLTGTVPESFGQEVPAHPIFEFYSSAGYAAGDPYTIQFTDTNGKTYLDSGTVGQDLYMSDVAAPFVVKNFTLTVTIPATETGNSSNTATSQSFTIDNFGIDGTFSTGNCDC